MVGEVALACRCQMNSIRQSHALPSGSLVVRDRIDDANFLRFEFRHDLVIAGPCLLQGSAGANVIAANQQNDGPRALGHCVVEPGENAGRRISINALIAHGVVLPLRPKHCLEKRRESFARRDTVALNNAGAERDDLGMRGSRANDLNNKNNSSVKSGFEPVPCVAIYVSPIPQCGAKRLQRNAACLILINTAPAQYGPELNPKLRSHTIERKHQIVPLISR